VRTISADKALKLFAASNQILELDLSRIEARYKVDLTRNLSRSDDKDKVYYPQFDESVRRDASRMAEHYEIFYCLEHTVRKLIADALDAVEPKAWWNASRIPQIIYNEVGKRIQRERDSGVTIRSEDPLDYTTFGELGEIIKQNWDVFGSIFNSIKAVEKVLGNLNLLRGPIAHCSPLAEDEVVRLQLSVRDWFRLME
jgi:hypothetical protein